MDGLAFGRPLLRRPADRPAVNIPPRKRRRIAYHEDEEDDEGFLALKDKEALSREDSADDENNDRQLIIHADFDDDDDDGDEEDDEDFAPGEDEDLEDSDDEDEDFEGDDDKLMDVEEQDEVTTEPQTAEGEADTDDELALADVIDESTRAKIRKLHSAFPDSPIAVCKHVLNGSHGDEGEAYEALTRGFRPVKPKSSITETPEDQTGFTVPKTRSKRRKGVAKKPEAPDSMQVEANETQDSLLDYYDRNDLPGASITSGRALLVMAQGAKISPTPKLHSASRGSTSVTSNQSIRFAAEGASNGLTSISFVDHESNERDANDEDTSSEGTSSSSSDSSSDAPSDSAEPTDTSSSGSDSDSGSDSSSDDGEAPEETSSKTSSANSPKLDYKTPPAISEVGKMPEPRPKATVRGKKATRARNQRRKMANALSRLQEKGILPVDTTTSEFRQLEGVDNNTSPEGALAALKALRTSKQFAELNETTDRALAKADEFEARKQALLASLASGGIEGGQGSLEERSLSPLAVQEAVTKTTTGVKPEKEVADSQPAAITSSKAPNTSQPAPNPGSQPEISEKSSEMRFSTAPEVTTAITPSASPKPPAASAESTQNSSTSSRRRLDLGAGRRLLFGALGIKNPKTKKDEDKLRNDLMKNVRPVKTAESPEVLSKVNEETIDEGPDAWREKITYRAVECCYDGVELSEPPFPFVQRWDPQQQASWSNKGDSGGKRKKDHRDEAQYYNDDPRVSKKQKRRKRKHNYAEEQQEYLDATYEPSFQHVTMDSKYKEQTHVPGLQREYFEGEISQRLMNDLKPQSAKVSQGPADLAPLPDDPSSLPDLEEDHAKVGMTVAFKQLVMSAATKWQPQMSAYRTAIVIAIPESGELHLTLAMRDRTRSKKNYDEETGERIYDKFDMPEDDNMEPEDDGILNLSFSELVEPKIVQEPPADLDTAPDSEVLPERNSVPNPDGFVTPLSHEEEPAEAQLSHVTETPVHSEAPEAPELIVPEVNDEKETFGNASEHAAKGVVEGVAEEAVTPSLRGDVPAIDVEIPTDPISDENREHISRLMKEAGFRSSVPSSILRDIRPDGMDSPGDAAVFEKLLKDMTEIQNPPYSPKFNGFGSSSPSRRQQDLLQSPSPEEGLPLREQPEPRSSPSLENEIADSPIRIPQSSWETVGPEDEHASSPTKATDEASGWVTEEPSSPPIRRPVKRKSSVKPPPKKVPISKAQAMWETLQPKNRRTSADFSAESSKTSTGPALLLGGTNEKDSNETVQYPKLSVGSSFTSQVADHGRQPDFNFDDSAEVNVADAPEVGESVTDLFLNEAVASDIEPDLPPRKTVNGRTGVKQSDHALSNPEPELTHSKSIDDQLEELPGSPKNVHELQDDAPSSDDPFPTLEEVFSQRSTKLEKRTPTPRKTPNKLEKAYQKSMAALSDYEYAEEADETTPKTSLNYTRTSKSRAADRRGSQTRAPQSRASQSQPSQPRASQSQSRFVLPQGSQVMDLTLSSDVEPEAEAEAEDDLGLDSDDAFMKDFKKYDDLKDDDFEDDAGWVPKKANTLKGVKIRRQTTVGLRASSQASRDRRNSTAG